jgi:hypothetical protein
LFQFLNPIWLFAAAAVVIPVAIHLWNIRPGKVLKVGSISLMDAASRKSSRSFKLLDIPLFILRCLLLALLALLLALPVWQKKLQAARVKGWVLIPRETFRESYPKFKPTIDSLNKAGYEFHFFNKGFAKSDLNEILAHPNDSVSTLNTKPVNYWGLINQLDTLVTSSLPLYIFTPGQAPYFKGQKPEVSLNLHWHTYIPADSTRSWIDGAWFNNDNTIRVVQGNSGPSGTSYSYATIKSGDQPASPFTVNVNNGRPVVSLKKGDLAPVPVDTATLRIAIYKGNNTADAAYLNAALQAVNRFMQRKTTITEYNDPDAIPPAQSWLFWLSEKPVNPKLIQQNQNIFLYQKGSVINADSWLSNSSDFSVALQQGHKIALYKWIAATPAGASVIWRDGFGHPVLTAQKQAQNNIYNFYSRFNPAWNDLVWSDEFPAWIIKLLIGNEQATGKYDKRMLDRQQIIPVNNSQIHTAVIKTTGFTNLTHYFWLALLLLFFAERWMANKTQNITTNGRG